MKKIAKLSYEKLKTGKSGEPLVQPTKVKFERSDVYYVDETTAAGLPHELIVAAHERRSIGDRILLFQVALATSAEIQNLIGFLNNKLAAMKFETK